MNVLDENFPENQRWLLQSQRVRTRQIGRDLARRGIPDDAILPLLHQLQRATLFTLDVGFDVGFYERRHCHPAYGIVTLEVREELAARYVRRLLRHPMFDTQAKHTGAVIRVSSSGIHLWRWRAEAEEQLGWRR
jgi:hypothetical protein